MEPIPPEARLLRAALDDPAVLQPDTPEARAAYALRDHVISRIGDALDDVAAPVLLVKGASLACRYPSPWLRPMHDIDLLVQLGDRPGVTDALLAAGFILREQDRNRDSSRTMICEHVVEWHGGNAMVEVDIHHHLDKIALRPVDHQGIVSRAEPHGDYPSLLVPCPADHLLLVVQHAAAAAFDHPPAWVDLERLLRQGIDIEAVIARAYSWQLQTPLWIALSTLRALGSELVADDWLSCLAPSAARRTLLRRFYRVGRFPVARHPAELGWAWVVRQTPLRDDVANWGKGVLEYAARRGIERFL